MSKSAAANDRGTPWLTLRHDDRGADVQHDPALQAREVRRQAPKIGVARLPDRGAVRGRVLVDDLGADRGVDGEVDPGAARGQEERQLGVLQVAPRLERTREGGAEAPAGAGPLAA